MAMQLNGNQYGLSSMMKEGSKHLEGTEEAVSRNITACKALSDITSTSFGPHGLNKLIINNLDKLFLTNDTGCILKELEVEHPAARLVLMASGQQAMEIGDGTNLVVLLAGRLLSSAGDLIRMGIKPSQIVEGYEEALKHTATLLKTDNAENSNLVAKEIKNIHKDNELLQSVLSHCLRSKQNGWQDILSSLLMKAIEIAHPAPSNDQSSHSSPSPSFNTDNVRFVKILGGGVEDSMVISGMALSQAPVGTVIQAKNAKVAVFACSISVGRTETKGTVLFKNHTEMSSFNEGEEAILKRQIGEIASAGIKVVVSGESISDLALHFLNENDVLALRCQSKFDLRRLCRAVGATPLARLGAPLPEEIGECASVSVREIGGIRCTIIDAPHRSNIATIILRSNTLSVLDDIERSLMVGCSLVRNLEQDGRLVWGSGACELEIARSLQGLASQTPGINQHAIKKFAEAFYVIPRALANNSGVSPTHQLATLQWSHEKGLTGAGIDGDSLVLDSLRVKQSAINLAVEAALTVLRVDQIIMAKAAGGPKPRPAGPQDADD